jgi:hypothetical protein
MLGVAFGVAYNFYFKFSPLSPLPFAIAFAALPSCIAISKDITPPTWMWAGGALFGMAAHFINVIKDMKADQISEIKGLPQQLGTRKSIIAASIINNTWHSSNHLLMNGSLAKGLVGSGEYLPAMAEFERSLIDDGLKNGKAANYIQIPTAAGQESPDRLDYWRQLGKAQADALGIESIFLPIFTREDAFNLEYANQIENSALIYFSGGDPHYLAQTLIGTPLVG